MRFVWPVFFLALLLLSSCSSLESALQTGVLGGKSAIRDRNAIRLETVNFPGSSILAVAGVPESTPSSSSDRLRPDFS